MSAAITKPQSADTTIERSKAPCGTRIGVVADKAATSSVIQALYSVPEVGFAEYLSCDLGCKKRQTFCGACLLRSD
jgi:hypothetical protein